MAQKGISAGDFTGKQRARLDRERAAQKAARAGEMSMVTGMQEQAKGDTVDYTDQKQGRKRGRKSASKAPIKNLTTGEEHEDPTIAAIVGDTVEPDPDALHPEYLGEDDEGAEVVRRPNVEIRSMADLEQVTIGIGTEYNFEYGRKYIVPYNVAFHLHEQGYCEVLRAV